MLEASAGFSTGCTKSILFLTDGTPDVGSWTPEIAEGIQTRARGMHIFTYALGDGADASVVKQIACDNAGAVWTVGDGGNLRDAMAAYYSFLAPMLAPCQVRWGYYNDTFSGEPLISACVPTFRKENAADATSCDGGTSGCMAELLGVVCMDVSLVVSTAALNARDDTPSFFDIVQQDRTRCATVTPTAAQLQAIRARIPAQFGDAVCPSQPSPAACAGRPPPALPASPPYTASPPYGPSDSGGSAAPILIPLLMLLCGCGIFGVWKVKNDQRKRTPPSQPPAAVEQVSASVGQRGPMSVVQMTPMPVVAAPVVPVMMGQPMAMPMAPPQQQPQVMTAQATVPGGQSMTIMHNGQQFNIQVPPGVQPGQSFQFQI